MPFWNRRPTAPPSRPTRAAPSGMAMYVLSPDGHLVAVKSNNGPVDAPWGGGQQRRGVTELTDTEDGYTRAYEACVWANRCIELRAQLTADLLDKARVVDRETRKVLPDHPLNQVFKLSYRYYQARYHYEYSRALDVFGEAYTEKVPASLFPGTAMPYTVRLLPNLAIEPQIMGGAIHSFLYTGDDNRMARLTPDQVAFQRRSGLRDTLRGLSRLASVMSAVNVDIFVVANAKYYFRNGARIPVIFVPEDPTGMTPTDTDVLIDELRKQKGIEKAHGPMFFSRPLKAVPIPQPELQDQQYLVGDTRGRVCAGFGVPVGLVMFDDAKFQLSPEMRPALYELTIIPQMRDQLEFINTNVVPYFDPREQVLLEVPENELAALTENMEKKTVIANSQFDGGAITFNERRAALRLPPVPGGDFFMLPTGRTVVPVDQMGQVVDLVAPANTVPAIELRTGAAATPAPVSVPALPAPANPPASSPPLARARRSIAVYKSSYGVPDGTVVLWLDELDDVLLLQQIIQRDYPAEAPIRWTPIEQLHVTLVHAALVDEGPFKAIFEAVQSQFPGFALHMTQVETFEGDGSSRPVIALIEPDESLRAFQKLLWQEFQARGVNTSEYSDPTAWRPHITLGYLPADVPFEPMNAGDMHCVARVMAFTRGAYETIEAVGAPETTVTVEKPAADIEGELKAWERKALSKGPQKAFTCHTIPDDVQASIRTGLALLDVDNQSGIRDVFSRARLQLSAIQGTAHTDEYPAGKAIQATRLDFEVELEDLLKAARMEQMDRRRFGTVLRALLRKYGTLAYRDGLIDGGLEDGELDEDDQATLTIALAEQSQYVTGFSEVLFKGDGISDALAEGKPALWFNKAIMPLYQAGRLSADKNGLYEFLLGNTEEHCDTCLRLAGQRHRLKDWAKRKLIPPGDEEHFECGGWKCDCKLQRLDKGRPKGSW